MKTNRMWIRQDKGNGEIQEVPESYIKERLSECYKDFPLALKHASEKSPLQNSFAYYWPKS